MPEISTEQLLSLYGHIARIELDWGQLADTVSRFAADDLLSAAGELGSFGVMVRERDRVLRNGRKELAQMRAELAAMVNEKRASAIDLAPVVDLYAEVARVQLDWGQLRETMDALANEDSLRDAGGIGPLTTTLSGAQSSMSDFELVLLNLREALRDMIVGR